MPSLVWLTIFLIPGLLTAQPGQSTPIVRSISVKAISSSPAGIPPIDFRAIAAAWERRQVNLAVERPLDLASVEKAKAVLTEVYREKGHAVRVEHDVHSMPPRAAEVSFQVIELCRCK